MQEEQIRRQLHQIVYKVKLSNLGKVGKVDLYSNFMTAGVYESSLQVQKGYQINENGCDLYLHLRNGPFPCRVFFTIEVVHWDGKDESARSEEFTYTYESATSYGWNIVSLNDLTAAASPYVKDGHITFIANVRILPPIKK
jgi:hypothetical protein